MSKKASSNKNRPICKNIPWIVIWVFIILINGISWISGAFVDVLRKTIFRISRGILGRFSSLFAFSLGEVLLIVAVLVALGLLIDGMLLVIFTIKKKAFPAGKIYAAVVGKIITVTALIMMLNCFPYYHASSFRDLYLDIDQKAYPPEDLIQLREHVIERANQLSKKVPRQTDGQLKTLDTRKEAVVAMQHLGETYPLFSGYYPVPKRLFWSGFFSQQYIMGYYFPFSMEANYNGVMYVSNVPFTQCHELSHTKGFMYEDDANFIGYLACVSSENEYFEYSGYLSVLDYLNNDLYDYLGQDIDLYKQYAQPNELVNRDNVFLTKETWAEVEEKAILDTETVHQASDAFLETNLQVNGVKEGTISYSMVVQRLLEYYEDHPLP